LRTLLHTILALLLLIPLAAGCQGNTDPTGADQKKSTGGDAGKQKAGPPPKDKIQWQ
jgi:hypothetical protein